MRSPFRKSDVRDRGVGLVEVLIAVILLGILSTAVIAIVLQAQASTVGNRSRVAASNLAAREVDMVREQFMATEDGPLKIVAEGVVVNPHSFGSPGSPLVVDGQAYTVRRSVSWNVAGAGASACEGGAMVKHPTLGVRVEVTWDDMGSIKPVVNTAQMAPEKGIGLGTGGSFVAVKVTDSKGQPNQGRSVTVSATRGGEVRTGLTDDSGCAVIEVSPAPSGTEYQAKVADAGFVDLGGDPEPVRLVGIVSPGELNSAIDIAYERAATLDINVITPGVSDATLAGSPVTVRKGGEYAGSSPDRVHALSGRRTLLSGLWPGDYAVYFGTDTPPELNYVTAMPGEQKRVEIDLANAEFRLTSMPASGDVVAVPGVGGSCSAAGATDVDPGAGELVPGTWSFFSDTDDFGCIVGPQGMLLASGDNGDLEWAQSELRVTTVPAGYGNKVWAVPVDAADQACRPPRSGMKAVSLGARASAQATLPAGDWYVFVTPKNADDVTPSDPCASTGLVSVAYGTSTTFGWSHPAPGPGGK